MSVAVGNHPRNREQNSYIPTIWLHLTEDLANFWSVAQVLDPSAHHTNPLTYTRIESDFREVAYGELKEVDVRAFDISSSKEFFVLSATRFEIKE